MDTNVNIVIISNKDDHRRCRKCCWNCLSSCYKSCKEFLPEMLTGILVLSLGILVIAGVSFLLSLLVGSLVIHSGLSCDNCNKCFACAEGAKGLGRIVIVGFITMSVSLLVPIFNVCIGFVLYSVAIEEVFVIDCLINNKLDFKQHILKKNDKEYYVLRCSPKDSESHQYPCKLIRKYHYIAHIMTYVLVYVISYVIVVMMNKFVLYTVLTIPISLIIDVPMQWIMHKMCPECIKRLCEKITIFD